MLLDRIVVSRIGRFLALTPSRPESLLDRFAATVVEAFDAFRAPPSPEETERRKHSGLSPAQEALLARWGYPYVMEEFRFHMTLTGAADPALLDCIEPAANAFFKEVVDRPLFSTRLSLRATGAGRSVPDRSTMADGRIEHAKNTGAGCFSAGLRPRARR